MAQNRKAARGTEPDPATGEADGTARGPGGAARAAEETGHQANVNQVRHEPIPASHHDDPPPDE